MRLQHLHDRMRQYTITRSLKINNSLVSFNLIVAFCSSFSRTFRVGGSTSPPTRSIKSLRPIHRSWLRSIWQGAHDRLVRKETDKSHDNCPRHSSDGGMGIRRRQYRDHERPGDDTAGKHTGCFARSRFRSASATSSRVAVSGSNTLMCNLLSVLCCNRFDERGTDRKCSRGEN